MNVAVDDDEFVTFRSNLSGDGWNFPWLSGKNSQVAHMYWTHNFGTYSKHWILENPASRVLKILFFPLGQNTNRVSKIAMFTYTEYISKHGYFWNTSRVSKIAMFTNILSVSMKHPNQWFFALSRDIIPAKRINS